MPLCSRVIEIWTHSTLVKLINLSPLDIILGYLHRDNQYIPINILIATTKYYIFKSALNKSVPNISGLKNKLKRKYEEQFYIHSECDYGETLFSCWGIFNNLFELAQLFLPNIRLDSIHQICSLTMLTYSVQTVKFC